MPLRNWHDICKEDGNTVGTAGQRFREIILFNFDRTEMQRAALAAVGALILSTTVVTAAVGPAMASGTLPATQVQTNVADGRLA